MPGICVAKIAIPFNDVAIFDVTEVPSNALLNDDGTPIINEDGSYIITSD